MSNRHPTDGATVPMWRACTCICTGAVQMHPMSRKSSWNNTHIKKSTQEALYTRNRLKRSQARILTVHRPPVCQHPYNQVCRTLSRICYQHIRSCSSPYRPQPNFVLIVHLGVSLLEGPINNVLSDTMQLGVIVLLLRCVVLQFHVKPWTRGAGKIQGMRETLRTTSAIPPKLSYTQKLVSYLPATWGGPLAIIVSRLTSFPSYSSGSSPFHVYKASFQWAMLHLQQQQTQRTWYVIQLLHTLVMSKMHTYWRCKHSSTLVVKYLPDRTETRGLSYFFSKQQPRYQSRSDRKGRITHWMKLGICQAHHVAYPRITPVTIIHVLMFFIAHF